MSDRLQRGFTLVELLIVSVIFMVIGAALITIFLTGRRSYLTTSAYIQVQEQARRAFDPIVRELRETSMSIVTADGTTTLPNNSKQLNFQIAKGYNLAAPCLPNAICWWNGITENTGWLHYSIVDTGELLNPWRLIRCANTDETGAITVSGPGFQLPANCRVLAHNILHPNTSNTPAFSYDATIRMVTVNLQFQYANPNLPGGSVGTPVLTSRIRLRND